MLVDSNRKKLTEILSLLYSSAVTSEVIQSKISIVWILISSESNKIL